MTAITEQRRSSIREVLPALRLGEVLGAGGGGWVIAAHDESCGERVAVKVLADEPLRAPLARSRLCTEAEILITCRHPNLVRGISFHEFGDMLLLVMERFDGTNVLQRQQGPRLPVLDACGIALAVARALHCVHEFGFLHGDVKPENVLFDPGGRHRIVDFGLARRWPFQRNHHVAGTPGYMAREAIVVDGVLVPATDVYALGMMTYELLAGRSPYLAADGPLAVMKMHVEAMPIPLLALAPSLPRELSDLVMTAIEKRAEDRVSSAGQFADRLLEIMNRCTRPAALAHRTAAAHQAVNRGQ